MDGWKLSAEKISLPSKAMKNTKNGRAGSLHG